jgi:hypothetical protein
VDGTTVRTASSYGNRIGFTGRYFGFESGRAQFNATREITEKIIAP